jgi:hypothetical protein
MAQKRWVPNLARHSRGGPLRETARPR